MDYCSTKIACNNTSIVTAITINYKNRINTTDSLTKYFDGVVEEVNLFYDIVDWENKKDKTDFTNGIEVANLTKIEVKY